MGTLDCVSPFANHLKIMEETYLLRRAVFSAADGSLFDVNDMCMSRSRGRRTGMHWTMMVPTISDEYQIFECALRQKYHASFWFPSSFQLMRMADMIATTIPYANIWISDLLSVWIENDASPTKLMVTQSPIFSTLRISSFHVTIQGKVARTKSMMRL